MSHMDFNEIESISSKMILIRSCTVTHVGSKGKLRNYFVMKGKNIKQRGKSKDLVNVNAYNTHVNFVMNSTLFDKV